MKNKSGYYCYHIILLPQRIRGSTTMRYINSHYITLHIILNCKKTHKGSHTMQSAMLRLYRFETQL